MNIKVTRVFRLGQTYLNERAKEYGLSSGLFFFILELAQQDGLTMQQLSHAVGVDNGHTTRVVKKLVESGYVDKKPNPQDSRSSYVFLTAKGCEMAKKINDFVIEWKQIVTSGVSEEEMAAVDSVFDKFYENASKALKNEPEM